MTPTGGDVVFFGDMGGNFYALDTTTGSKLWGQKIGGAIGGRVVTDAVNGTQKVAVAHGLTEILWPTEITTAKVSVQGLESGAEKRGYWRKLGWTETRASEREPRPDAKSNEDSGDAFAGRPRSSVRNGSASAEWYRKTPPLPRRGSRQKGRILGFQLP